MRRDDPLVLLGENELDLVFRKDETNYSMMILLSLMEPAQRQLMHEFALSLYRLGYRRSGRFLADGTWQGGDDERN